MASNKEDGVTDADQGLDLLDDIIDFDQFEFDEPANATEHKNSANDDVGVQPDAKRNTAAAAAAAAAAKDTNESVHNVPPLPAQSDRESRKQAGRKELDSSKPGGFVSRPQNTESNRRKRRRSRSRSPKRNNVVNRSGYDQRRVGQPRNNDRDHPQYQRGISPRTIPRDAAANSWKGGRTRGPGTADQARWQEEARYSPRRHERHDSYGPSRAGDFKPRPTGYIPQPREYSPPPRELSPRHRVYSPQPQQYGPSRPPRDVSPHRRDRDIRPHDSMELSVRRQEYSPRREYSPRYDRYDDRYYDEDRDLPIRPREREDHYRSRSPVSDRGRLRDANDRHLENSFDDASQGRTSREEVSTAQAPQKPKENKKNKRRRKAKSPPPQPTNKDKFYMIKSVNYLNVNFSMDKGIWSTPKPQNQRLFQSAFKNFSNVYFFFSVNGSERFQGYARMTSDVRKEETKWASPKGTVKLDNVFNVEWLNATGLSFAVVDNLNLRNTLNQNKAVKIGRDGQEISFRVAKQLIELMNQVNQLASVPQEDLPAVTDEAELRQPRISKPTDTETNVQAMSRTIGSSEVGSHASETPVSANSQQSRTPNTKTPEGHISNRMRNRLSFPSGNNQQAAKKKSMQDRLSLKPTTQRKVSRAQVEKKTGVESRIMRKSKSAQNVTTSSFSPHQQDFRSNAMSRSISRSPPRNVYVRNDRNQQPQRDSEHQGRVRQPSDHRGKAGR